MARNGRWYLGSMNDGLFIIDKPPSPSGTDVPPWDNPNGPDLVLNVVALTHEQAQAIVDAHNAAIAAIERERPYVPDSLARDAGRRLAGLR